VCSLYQTEVPKRKLNHEDTKDTKGFLGLVLTSPTWTEERKKNQFEKARKVLSRWGDGESAWFRGLKGRDIPAQGNALGIGYKDC